MGFEDVGFWYQIPDGFGRAPGRFRRQPEFTLVPPTNKARPRRLSLIDFNRTQAIPLMETSLKRRGGGA